MTSRINFDLGKMARRMPKIVADGINNIGVIIIKDMRAGVATGVDINGSRFTKLKSGTVARKRAQGAPLPSTALIETTQMIGTGDPRQVDRGIFLQIKATKARLLARITIVFSRIKIAIAHQEGSGHLPKREFFGLSRRIIKPIDKELKKVGGKIVKSMRK